MGERLPSKKSFVCSFVDCKAAFSKSWKLQAHLCNHTGLKPFSCNNCDKSFCTRSQLTRHELTHSGEKPHKCVVEGCSEAFVTNASLKNHTSKFHNQEKKYKCNHQGCEKDFNKRNQLSAHMFVHSKALPFHCKISGCTKEFPSHGKLKHHEKMHDGYPCEEEACIFKGNTWTEYLKHRKSHKVKLPCAQCKKQFSNAWFLNLHIRHVHSGEKRMFPCPREGCEKKFSRCFHLESHVLGVHEGLKAFTCAAAGCGKSFAMKESLWRHGIVHDPSKKLKKLGNQKEENKLAAKLAKTNLNE
ncbi:general transcription factor IIIA, b [Periophthalmus magnuspinnatus]|uniref:general transcription factor IIIA, b n=1 Tax=Periophthalmus magnuspinnatus TaxID=409849 RepID=UPI0024373B26|nr:general transcription factor IIIA, b [Periophthalmus magnuspinnatus]